MIRKSSFLRRVAFLMVSMIFLGARSLFEWGFGGGHQYSVNILCYHGVPPRRRDSFTWQLNYLARHFSFIHPDALSSFALNGKKILITFDDALLSLVENAIPELKRLSIPCLIFVPTGFLGLKCSWMRSPEVWHATKKRPMSKRDLEQLELDRVMTRDELGSLDSSLCTLGSHSVHHKRLGELSINELRHELISSCNTIFEITGKRPRTISFPHGHYTDVVLKEVADSGYETGFTITPCIIHENKRILGRVVVEPSDWKLEFIIKVHGGYTWVSKIRRIKNWWIMRLSKKLQF